MGGLMATFLRPDISEGLDQPRIAGTAGTAVSKVAR
jgi:hypothetical protein